jgi:aminoglycoside phosphotransferase (APT) family kinase protein
LCHILRMEADIQRFLSDFGLVSSRDEIDCTPLAGGVSCDVWRIDAAGQAICVKRALPRLRVSALWQAPVSRSTHEWLWMKFAAGVVPDSIPRPLAHDPTHGLLAMAFLDPIRYPIWKEQLLRGKVDVETAGVVAGILTQLHAASAGRPEIAALFDTDEAFHALRIEPYLLEAARRNPDVAKTIQEIAEQTMGTRIALVHGDVSPKNILVGPSGPVFLDAETAWYGDPAFDLAFCLNHLLLKCLARPSSRDNYLASFRNLASCYLCSVSWEPPAGLECRVVVLLPALLLARVDGKSPVEYLTEHDRTFVREISRRWLVQPPDSLDEIARLWRAALSGLETPEE